MLWNLVIFNKKSAWFLFSTSTHRVWFLGVFFYCNRLNVTRDYVFYYKCWQVCYWCFCRFNYYESRETCFCLIVRISFRKGSLEFFLGRKSDECYLLFTGPMLLCSEWIWGGDPFTLTETGIHYQYTRVKKKRPKTAVGLQMHKTPNLVEVLNLTLNTINPQPPLSSTYKLKGRGKCSA